MTQDGAEAKTFPTFVTVVSPGSSVRHDVGALAKALPTLMRPFLHCEFTEAKQVCVAKNFPQSAALTMTSSAVKGLPMLDAVQLAVAGTRESRRCSGSSSHR